MLNKIHRYPFLRLVVPLIAGIVFGDYLFNQSYPHLSVVLFSLFFSSILLLILSYRFIVSYRNRWIFGLFTFLCLFFLGGSIISLKLEQTKFDFSHNPQTYLVELTDRPQVKERSVLCKINIIYKIDSISKTQVSKNALLYLSKDSTCLPLSAGDHLLVNTRFAKPKSRNNPEEFDYSRFLHRKGITATAFVDSLHWQSVYKAAKPDARETANRWRDRIVSIYKRLGFEGENLAVLSALTLGYKEGLDSDTREAYSVAGASHILAISGMHIGFLCALLLFIFRLIPDRWFLTRFVRVVLIISILWLFAFLVGLTPSAVRSVCMFSLLLIGSLFHRKQDSLNILFATAFIMLLIDPSWLFEIGFQLSLMAVLSILIWQPIYQRLLPKTNRVGRFIVGILLVSIAAQLGVAPLIILYFSSFSTHFLLTNLLVVPLVSLIIYGSFIMLLVGFLPFVQTAVATCLNLLLNILNGSIHWIEQLPYASLDNLWMHHFEVVLFYILVLLTVFFIYRANSKRLLATLLCLFMLFAVRLSFLYINRPETSIVFYNIRNFPVVHCINSDKSSLIASSDTLLNIANYPPLLKPYWNKIQLETPQLITRNAESSHFIMNNHIIQFYNKRICIVSDDRWNSFSTDTPLVIDYLYICKGYKGELKELLNLFQAKQVVIDSTISSYWQAKFENECKQEGVRFYSLSDKGSARFLL